MSSMYTPGFVMNDAEQRVWNYFVSQVARIENDVFEIEYPDIIYPQLVPVDSTGDQWTQVVTYYSSDSVGQAQWFHADAHDVPLVSDTKNAASATVQMAAIGYRYNEEELAVSSRLGRNLTTDRANTARRAAEEFIERIAFFGDSTMGFTGLTNNASVTAGSVAADGTGSTTTWATKTGDQIIRDINAALSGIYTSSYGIQTADTLLMSLQAFNEISTRRVAAELPITILEWVLRNNAFTAQTGRELTIRAVPRLDTAGAGSTSRMIAYRRSPDVIRMYVPMPFQFRGPWRTGPLVYEVPGVMRLGGVDVRQPAAMRYLDGV